MTQQQRGCFRAARSLPVLLAEVLVAITAVAQAKHRHHEKERDQAKRRKDNSTIISHCTALLAPPNQTLLGFSPVTIEDLKIVFLDTALEEYFTSFTHFCTFIHAGNTLAKGALSEKLHIVNRVIINLVGERPLHPEPLALSLLGHSAVPDELPGKHRF